MLNRHIVPIKDTRMMFFDREQRQEVLRIKLFLQHTFTKLLNYEMKCTSRLVRNGKMKNVSV